MSDLAAALALQFLQLTGPGGQVIEVNPQHIVSLRDRREEEEGHFHGQVHCLIHTDDGKFVAVQEDCVTVQQRLNALED